MCVYGGEGGGRGGGEREREREREREDFTAGTVTPGVQFLYRSLEAKFIM